MQGISWTELFDRADFVIHSTLMDAKRNGRALLLQPSTRVGSLLLLAVGLRWPHPVILDEKCLLTAVDAMRLHEKDIPAGLLPTLPCIRGGEAPSLAGLENWRLVLYTSGSTGEPKRIEKSGRGLLAEVRDLAGIYGFDARSSLLSLVSPLHIYGLLHSFLLPLFCQSSVEFVSFSEGPVNPLDLFADRYAGVIAVPATWSFIKDLLQVMQLGTLVMSGAPFGEKRREELQGSMKKPDRALEILGSTETGGIGFRSLLAESSAFQLMPSVCLGSDWVESPYLWPETRVALSDRLELQVDGTFLHRGRADRIFKYASQRYALAEVENALSQSFARAETFAIFHGDDRVAQGGWLEAWVESEEQSLTAEVRASYRSNTSAPFPQVLHFLVPFPRDPQGKLQLRPPG